VTEHVLKCLPPYYDALERGDKNFEVRRDDRGFQRGDILVLRCWSPKEGFWLSEDPPVGEPIKLRRRVIYVLTGGQFGIEPGHVVMGLEPEEVGSVICEETAEIPGDIWHKFAILSQYREVSPPEGAAKAEEPNWGSDPSPQELDLIQRISRWLLREAEAMGDGYGDDMYRSVAERLQSGDYQRRYCPVAARLCGDDRCFHGAACRQIAR
jgi:hypothetical protein